MHALATAPPPPSAETGTGGRRAGSPASPKVDEHRQAEDGTFYSKAEFIDYYGGTDEWDAAAETALPATALDDSDDSD